jgi:hypothetical protein
VHQVALSRHWVTPSQPLARITQAARQKNADRITL